MEPDEAEDVRRLMSYAEETAGAMMTPEPVILGPDATIADALAQIRHAELPVSLAAMVYVCRQPLETPTGQLLGVAHFQRLLREPPSTLVAAALDQSMDPLHPEATIDEVAAHLATYNLVAAPVVDDDGRLLGAVTVDDLLDHMLPENWRDQPLGTAPRRRCAMAERRGGRLDTPKEQRRPLIRTPSYDRDAFGVFAEQFARFMGTARFLMWMTVVVVFWIAWNTLAPARPAVRRVPVHLPDPDPQPAGVVRRAADPARAEPAGVARQGRGRAGPPGQRPRPRGHGVPGPRGRLTADGRRRGRDPRLPAVRAAVAARRPRRPGRRRGGHARPEGRHLRIGASL